MIQRILSVVSGVVLGGFAVALVEGITSSLVEAPPPPTEPEALAAWFDAVPFGLKVGVVVAWVVGGLTAGVSAGFFGREHGARGAWIAAGLMTSITLLNLVAAPFVHPPWMWLGGLVLPVLLGGPAGQAVAAWRTAPQAEPPPPAPSTPPS